MSIELSKVKESQDSCSFDMEVSMPNMKPKSTAMTIDTKNTNMEKKKEKKMEKKKPEPKFFYEYLEEAAKKKIRPSTHRHEDSVPPKEQDAQYDCPIAMVCELLGDKYMMNEGCTGCTGSQQHKGLMDRLRDMKVKFMDTQMNYCPVCDGSPYGHANRAHFNELMLSCHISQYHHQGPFNTAQMLKEYLYGEKAKKMIELPKEEPHMYISDRVAEPRSLTFTVRGLDMAETFKTFGENLKLQSIDTSFDPGTDRVVTKYTGYVRKADGSLELKEFYDNR